MACAEPKTTLLRKWQLEKGPRNYSSGLHSADDSTDIDITYWLSADRWIVKLRATVRVKP